MLELSNVFNPFHIFLLHKLERNGSNIFIGVCICKEFSSIFNTLRMLEPYFCKNFVNIEFLEGWNLVLNVFKKKKFCLDKQNFFVQILSSLWALNSNLNKKTKTKQGSTNSSSQSSLRIFLFFWVSRCINNETQIFGGLMKDSIL